VQPVRYILMQRYLYSGRWIKPVSDTGRAVMDEWLTFHEDMRTQGRVRR